jgi:predicted transcriptional regulator
MGTRKRLAANRRSWTPRKDHTAFRARGTMPNVFGSFDRTELIAFLAIHGSKRLIELAEAFRVGHPSMLRRLRAAERGGLIERGRTTADYYRLDHDHPAFEQIRQLARRLGEIYSIPAPARRVREVHVRLRLSPRRTYKAVDVLRAPLNPLRSEVLLLTAAIRRPIPISFIAGILGRRRFCVSECVNAFETFGIMRSQHDGPFRYVSLNGAWAAYPELRALLVRLLRLDPQWRAYAASYECAIGAPAYKI